MRLFGPSGLRTAWEDRTPTRINRSEAQTARAGGTDTIVWTYTVSAIRRARVFHAGEYGTISTALAAGQVADVIVQVQQGGAGPVFFLAFQRLIGAALGTLERAEVHGAYLVAGDLIQGRVVVSAGAGVVTTAGGLSLMEYDI